MKRLLLFLCFVPVICFGQYRADRTRTNPNVADGNGYCFRGHLATATSSYCAEALALFARMDTAPDASRKCLINTLIEAYKGKGIWDSLIAFVPYASHTEQSSLLNWKDTAYNSTNMSNMVWTKDRGFQRTGATGYINTNVNMSTIAGLAYNRVMFGMYVQSDTTIGIIGVRGYVGGFWQQDRVKSNYTYHASFDAEISNGAGFANTNQKGLFIAQRNKNDSIYGYANGTKYKYNSAPVTTNLLSANILVGAIFYINSSTVEYEGHNQYSLFVVSRPLSDEQQAYFYSYLQDYLYAIGADAN
jgi:hypothetical protein